MSVSPINMDELLKILEKFHIKKDSLINDLNNKKLSPKEYANKINEEILDVIDKISRENYIQDNLKKFLILNKVKR